MIIYVGRDGFYVDVDIWVNVVDGFCMVKKVEMLVGIGCNDFIWKYWIVNSKFIGLLW